MVFLEMADRIFEAYGDIPFVHWATYEKTYLRRYVDRYGDVDGVAARVEANLLDLLRSRKTPSFSRCRATASRSSSSTSVSSASSPNSAASGRWRRSSRQPKRATRKNGKS